MEKVSRDQGVKRRLQSTESSVKRDRVEETAMARDRLGLRSRPGILLLPQSGPGRGGGKYWPGPSPRLNFKFVYRIFWHIRRPFKCKTHPFLTSFLTAQFM